MLVKRSLSTFLVAAFVASVTAGCATYSQDLERGRKHYDQNQYEAALALFRVLEHDTDSFTAAERAQYAYLRGMTDYRLSSIAAQGSSVSDPKRAFRDNARHWLSVASAIEKQSAGGLSDDEKSRLAEAMKDLNKDWYSGADADADEPKKDDAAKKDDGAAKKDDAKKDEPKKKE
jgi:hypothetical protein